MAGWRWLQRAAEMAAQATGSGPLLPSTATLGWTWLPRVAMRTPGTEPGSICAARKFATTTMQRWGVADREADVAVVVSELLTNAVRHALPLAADPPDRPIRLGLLHWATSVLCAVADPSEQVPVPREPAWLEESGRGLHVIASLSDQWGSCPAPGQPGKVVWATFRSAPQSAPR